MGDVVSWLYQGLPQVGIVASIRRRDATVFVIPLRKPTLTIPRPADQISLLLDVTSLETTARNSLR